MVRDGAVAVALGAIGAAAVVIGTGRFRIEPDHLVVVGDGVVVVAFSEVVVAAVAIGTGRFRIEPDRFVEVGNGAVVVALGAIGDAAVVVGPAEVLSTIFAGLDRVGAARNLLLRRKIGIARALPILWRLREPRRDRPSEQQCRHRNDAIKSKSAQI